MLQINDELSIPESELRFTASRSAGPGGQHVNKVNSRMTLHYDVDGSASLSDAQRRRIRARLPTRINRNGTLKLHCQRHRSQAANREVLNERFVELIRWALSRQRRRKKTVTPRSVRERRLQHKRRRSELKKLRSRPDDG